MKIPSDHMRTLKRRVDFLKSREHKNSFDLAELGALEWAIVNLQPAQRQWVGLTEHELESLWYHAETGGAMLLRFAEAIEAKLKEKNT